MRRACTCDRGVTSLPVNLRLARRGRRSDTRWWSARLRTYEPSRFISYGPSKKPSSVGVGAVSSPSEG